MGRLTIATRASALALWQARYIRDRIGELFPDVEVELLELTSRGDKILDRPLALVGGKGHFTKELEDAMLEGRAQMAVHSLKDVPTFIPEGLSLAAITRREDQSDVFLSHRYAAIDALPSGAIVGTTSLRRRMQLLRRRPDLRVRDLRGNVNTRLRKLAEGEYDGIILAAIGLERLGLLASIPHVERLAWMIPPMGQAALGIEIVADDPLARRIAAALDDEATHLCTWIERDFVSAVGAGCSAPVAVNARFVAEGTIEVRAMLGYPDGSEVLYDETTCTPDEASSAGTAFAHRFIDRGALELLAEAEKRAFKEERPERL